jgi:hypothetical protein
MLADHGHPEVGAVLAAITLRDRKAQMAGGVGQIFDLSQQRFPFVPRQAALIEIGARPFAAMVEETDVVVDLFQRLDLARDEAIEFIEIATNACSCLASSYSAFSEMSPNSLAWRMRSLTSRR